MSEVLETTVDKFTFRVPTDRFYTDAGLWVLREGGESFARIGLSDFLQQTSGDVTFADVHPEGTILADGDVFAVVETIKASIELNSPVAGTIVEINPAMATAPEAINQDPYGVGWLVRVELSSPETARVHLLDPPAYFALMKREAEEEAKKR